MPNPHLGYNRLMRSVFLVGFMGCGKSTVGKSLAENLGLPFVDLDEEIEQTEGAPSPRFSNVKANPNSEPWRHERSRLRR